MKRIRFPVDREAVARLIGMKMEYWFPGTCCANEVRDDIADAVIELLTLPLDEEKVWRAVASEFRDDAVPPEQMQSWRDVTCAALEAAGLELLDE